MAPAWLAWSPRGSGLAWPERLAFEPSEAVARPAQAPDLSGLKMPDLSSLKLPDAPDLSSLKLPDAPDLSSLKLPDAADLSSLKLPDAPDLSGLTSSLPPNPLAVQPASALEFEPSSLAAPDLSSVKMPEMPEVDLSSVKLPELDSAALLSKLTEAAAPLVKAHAPPAPRSGAPHRARPSHQTGPEPPRTAHARRARLSPVLARWPRPRTAAAACPRPAGAFLCGGRPVGHRREGHRLERDGARQQRERPGEQRGQRRGHHGGRLLGRGVDATRARRRRRRRPRRRRRARGRRGHGAPARPHTCPRPPTGRPPARPRWPAPGTARAPEAGSLWPKRGRPSRARLQALRLIGRVVDVLVVGGLTVTVSLIKTIISSLAGIVTGAVVGAFVGPGPVLGALSQTATQGVKDKFAAAPPAASSSAADE